MMKRSFFLFSIIALVSFGCARNFRDTTQYLQTGKLKPIVAVLPVIDNSGEKSLSWDLSHEFTEELKTRFLDSSRVYLLREEKGSLSEAKSLCDALPNNLPKSALAGFSPAEFVVVSELLEQKITPYGITSGHSDRPFVSEVGAMLTLSMRIRVIDVRHEKPEVILQEVVDSDYNISRPYLYCDYQKCKWGSEEFTRTPMGIAHARLIRDVISHIEGYVSAR